METVLISGGTGLVGRSLTQMLVEKGYRVIILSRRPPSRAPEANIRFARWDPGKGQIDPEAVTAASAIVLLAGAGIADKRWSTKRKREIANSRVQGSELILRAMTESGHSVKTLISASATGWYGADPQVPSSRPFTENDPPDPGFLGETCRLWEAALDPASPMADRLIKIRTGIVLSNQGGALPAFEKPLAFGLAAILGSGKQVISWIHIRDLCRIYLEALANREIRGVYNAVAPFPVDNRTLTLELANRRKGSFFLPLRIPSYFLRFALGEMSLEVLKSATVSPDKIKQTGFQFLYPRIESALEDLIGPGRNRS